MTPGVGLTGHAGTMSYRRPFQNRDESLPHFGVMPTLVNPLRRRMRLYYMAWIPLTVNENEKKIEGLAHPRLAKYILEG